MTARATSRFGRRALLAGLVALGGLLAFGLGFPRAKLHVIAFKLARRFPYLRVDHDVILRFLRDYETGVRPLSKRSALPGFPLDPGVTERFLLSTDLFPTGDVSRQLAYTGLYGWIACASPTSHGPLDAEELAAGEGRAGFLARYPAYRGRRSASRPLVPTRLVEPTAPEAAAADPEP